MLWTEELKERKEKANSINKQINILEKEIKKLEKEKKNIGSLSPFEIIREEIEKRYGYPCRLFRTNGLAELAIFKKNSTAKQIRYNREEMHIGSILLEKSDDKIVVNVHKYCKPEIPSEIDELFDYIIHEKWRDDIKRMILEYEGDGNEQTRIS